MKRKQHILEHHPEVAKYLNCIPNILKNPDCIFWEINRESTIWLVKKFDRNIRNWNIIKLFDKNNPV